MPEVRAFVERASKSVGEKGRAVGQKIEQVKRVFPDDTREAINTLQTNFRDKHPVLSLQFLSTFETRSTRTTRLEENLSEEGMVGDHFTARVDAYVAKHKSIPRERAEQMLHEQDAKYLFKHCSGKDYTLIKRIVSQNVGAEGPINSKFDEIKEYLRAQIPEADDERNKALAKLIASLLLVVPADVGKQATEGI